MVVVMTGTKVDLVSVQHGEKPATNVIGRITMKQYAECYLQEGDKATTQP